jgi:hypothetical protein
MKYLKRFNENNTDLPFRSKLLYKDSNIGKYELYVDGDTGWGIIFPNGYMEVEEGPHESVGFMNGEINGISISARGYDVPRIPGEYWMGEMSSDELLKFLDSAISRYNNITKESFINESKGFEILPEDALKELSDYVDYQNSENKIEVVPDPRVDGTYAVRVYRSDDDVTFDLLWNRGAYDEVEFSSWPPVSGDNLKFFY